MADKCPDGWTHDTVRGLTIRHYSGPSPTCDERNVRNAEEWGLLKTTAITWNGWDESAHKVPPPVYWGNRHLEVRSGDVLITKAGPRHRVGVVVYVPSTQPHLMVSGKMVGLQPDAQKVFSSVLAGLLSTPHAQKYLDQRTTGMAESQVNFANSTLLSIPLCVPPLPEQQQIGEILDTLDEAIRRTEQIIAKLRQFKQGLLHDLLTRGIDQNGELRDSERHPEQFRDSPLGLIPNVWPLVKLAALTSRIVDGVHHTPTYVSQGVPFLTVENLSRGAAISLTPCRYVSDRDNALYRRRADPKPGDVLVSKDGTLGIARTVPDGFPEVSIFVSVALLRPRTDRVVPEFICEFFEGPWFAQQLGRQSAGTGLRHIHLEHFREFLLAVPPLKEQQRLISVLDGLSARLDREFKELSKLRLIKQGLMEDLLTGRVRVTSLKAAA